MKKVRALQKGDTIGIAASASPFDRNEFKKGVKAIETMGFSVYHRDDIFDQTRYLAGSDKRRAEELHELFKSPKIKAIMFARGGYGSQRIIPLLDPKLICNHPKPVIGFSDVTALLTFLRQECGSPTFYGPVVSSFAKECDSITKEYLHAALTTSGPLGEIPVGSAIVLKAGRAEGALVGGCLSLINSSMGTPYELKTEGSVLFIEEIGEKVYVLDRMLTQLKNAGKFSDVKGIVFGSIITQQGEPHDVHAMIKDVFSDFAGPIVVDYPAGHTKTFVTLPLGAQCEIDATEADKPRLKFKTGLLT